MAEISHVRMGVPDQGTLSRVLREAGTTMFPQWLYAEPHDDAQILWWGIRGAPTQLLEVPDDSAKRRLFPRPNDDWSDAPRGLVLATLDAERAAAELEPVMGKDWHAVADDPLLAARCYRIALGHGFMVLAEPMAEGYTAACLARFGEGPIGVALDGSAATGRQVRSNPVTLGPATYVRIGERTAPLLIFLPAG
jgi:hypothetical protein